MLSSAKPLASLSSGLLARKGQARPAMRPQGFHGVPTHLDDLGWNDMGEPHAADPASLPPVLVEREELAQHLSGEPAAAEAPEPAAATERVTEPVAEMTVETAPRVVSTATAARIAREVSAGKAKAAFTLRLDGDRHLRLRLASASRHRSAQQLVTEALDRFLASLPEIEGLAAQLASAPKAPRGK